MNVFAFAIVARHILSYRGCVDPNANGLSRVDQNQDGSLTRVELIKRLRKDEELVSLLKLPKHVSDGDRGAFEAVFQGCVFANLLIRLCTTDYTSKESCAVWEHSMDTNDDRNVDMHEFVTFFARRHVEGGWLKREADPGSEVLALADGIVEAQATIDINCSTSSQDTPAKGGKKSKGGKGKGPKKKKKKQ